MSFGECYVAQQCNSKRSNRCNADGRGDVIVTGRNIRGQRSKYVERSLISPLQLLLHILRNLVKGHIARSLVHDLNIVLLSSTCQLILCEHR